MTGWFTGCLAETASSWQTSWLTDWLAETMSNCLAGFFDWMADWLIDGPLWRQNCVYFRCDVYSPAGVSWLERILHANFSHLYVMVSQSLPQILASKLGVQMRGTDLKRQSVWAGQKWWNGVNKSLSLFTHIHTHSQNQLPSLSRAVKAVRKSILPQYMNLWIFQSSYSGSVENSLLTGGNRILLFILFSKHLALK